MREERQEIFLELDVTDEELEWARTYMDGTWWEKNYEEEYMGFDMCVTIEGRLLITSDHVAPDHVADFLRWLIRRWRPKESVRFEVCWHGDQDYGGLCWVVTATKDVIFNPWDMAGQWIQTGACAPEVKDYATGMEKMEESIHEDHDRRSRP